MLFYPGRDLVGREERAAHLDREVHLVGHLQGAGERLGQVLEELPHLVGGLQVEVLGLEAPALRVVEVGPRLQAEQDVVGLGVVAVDVVQVVGRHQAQAELLRKAAQGLVDALLGVDAVPLHLEQVAVRPEDVAVGGDGLPGPVHVVLGDLRRDLAAEAAGEHDQALRVGCQHLAVDPGLVVEALLLADGAQGHQVPVTLGVGGQDGQVVGVPVHLGLPVQAAAGRDVGLEAQDRLDPGLPARLVEVDGAVHRAVVRQGQGRHLQLGGPGDHRVDATGAVEQRELRVVVEVDEGIGGVWHRRGQGGLRRF